MPRRLLIALAAVAAASVTPARAQQARVLDLGHGMFEAIGVAVGTGGDRTVAVLASNTFLATTADGSVVVDTSLAAAAAAHKQALSDKSRAPIKAIILTHAHGDHTDVALASDSTHRRTLDVRLAILQALDRQSKNSNERGWLAAGIRDVEARLKR